MSQFQVKRTPPVLMVAFVFCIAIMMSISPIGCGRSDSSHQTLSQARLALIRGDFSEAERLASLLPEQDSLFIKAAFVAGEACTKANRLEAAVSYYLRVLDGKPTDKQRQLATFSIAEIKLQQCRLMEAEKLYQEVLESQPGNLIVNERLAFLLSLTGRRWDSLKHYFVLIKSGEATYRELSLAADVGRAVEQPEYLQKCLEVNPDGILVRLSVAYRRAEEGRLDVAKELQSIVAEAPDLMAAQAILGGLLFDLQDDEGFRRWHSELPNSADSSPDIWYTRGLWARRAGYLEIAVDCFLQSIDKSVFHREAFYALGQTLSALDSPSAETVVEHAGKLTRLTQQIDEVLNSEAQHRVALQECAELLESLGRTWEACAWAVIGRRIAPEAQWHQRITAKHGARLTDDLPWIEPGFNPVEKIPLKNLNFGEWLSNVPLDSTGPPEVSKLIAQPRFEQVPGVKFTYSNADDPSTPGMRMFEQTGGGVGILDVDCDSSPDVYLPQGCPWPTGSDTPLPDPEVTDTLLRNRLPLSVAGPSVASYQDVSFAIESGTSGFGQGCTVGDFNNDGFDDVYVANVGQNRLLQGLGDGTFCDVTLESGISDNSWTVSAMMCDLNADDLPDLFDVNYVEGDGVYTKICNGKSCSPKVFLGAPDIVWINQGDGTFEKVISPAASGMSKGLGIAAFETDTRRRPQVFVANDQVANFFLSNRPADNRHNLLLSNSAMVTGLAFNEDGLAMACMGIAVDDFDANGFPDLFVTNFQEEPNTLYLQEAHNMFRDSTRTYGLYAAGLPMTGWGVQPLDADLDGRPDIVVANGHVDDYTDVGGPFRMKPHFYHQQANRFESLTGEQVGPWFDGEYLGRGLARVDWNKDGRPEFIASLINQPVAVMLNTTEDAGHFLKFKLKATESARDAIGATVSVTTESSTVKRQLFAGDGYMASNERIVTFGLGTETMIDSIDIHWPSGAHTVMDAPLVDQFYLVTESAPSATMQDVSGCSSMSVQVISSDESKQ